jgi:rhodanese-related sulfurtransferase
MSRHRLITLIAILVVAAPVSAIEPIPVTANEAFDAVQTQTDPLDTNKDAKVVLVDVRSRAEYFWVGAAMEVKEITLKSSDAVNVEPIVPDLGKVHLSHNGIFLDYNVDGQSQRVLVADVEKLEMSPIATNVPFRLWDEEMASLVPNPGFEAGINELITSGAEILILFCRSGGRSSACPEEFPDVFAGVTVYEIDDPAGVNGRGGFEGPTYGEAYNGYIGFPGRLTEVQETPSVSWKDSGLPIQTLTSPLPSSE